MKKSVTKHRCLGCFLETEKTLERNEWKTFMPDRKRWYKMVNDENEVIRDYINKYKPKRIIEIGCGPGRLIAVIEKIGFENFDEIVGIEADAGMYDYSSKRWHNDKVKIIKMFVKGKKRELPYPDNYFDFCINAMNIVGWQRNEKQWLEEMLRCSKVVFFTLYKKGFEKERIEMYKNRGHTISKEGAHIENDQIILGDCALMPCVYSKAYTREGVEKLCREISSKYKASYKIYNMLNELFYVCFISKKELRGAKSGI